MARIPVARSLSMDVYIRTCILIPSSSSYNLLSDIWDGWMGK